MSVVTSWVEHPPSTAVPQLGPQPVGVGGAQRVGDDDALDHVGEHRRTRPTVDAHGDDRAGVGAAADRAVEARRCGAGTGSSERPDLDGVPPW